MRVLFFDDNEVLISLLPNGFRCAGHEVMISKKRTEGEISEIIESFNPQLIITQGWGLLTGNTLFQETIGLKAREAKVPLVYWSVEDPIWTQGFVLPLVNRMKPNFIFTICPSIQKFYHKRGYKCAHLDFGYNSSISTEKNEEKFDVALVANTYNEHEAYYKYRNDSFETLLVPLLKSNFRVDFWGKGWRKYGKKFGVEIPEDWIHEPLPYSEVNKIYNSSKIVLCPQNFEEQLTLRTYDILGSESFLLTINSEAIRKNFKIGKELMVSSSPEETLKVVEYYLKNPLERKKISQNGRMAVLHHSYKHRAETMIQKLINWGILSKEIL